MNTIVVDGMGIKQVVLLDIADSVSEHTLRAAFNLENDVPIGLFVMNDGKKINLTRKEEPQDQFYFSLPKGWTDFGLTWDETRRSRPSTPIQPHSTSVAEIDSEGMRMGDERPIDVKDESFKFTVKRCRGFMLYFLLEKSGDEFIDGSVRKCATVYDTKFALTAGHCIPDGLPSNYPFNLYDNDGKTYRVNAVKVHKQGEGGNDDYSILKLIEGDFANFPNGLALPCDGERYFVLGYDAEYPTVFHLSCFTGVFRNTKIYKNVSYVIGSPGTTDGCSGGGVFDKWGHLFGICVGGRLKWTNPNKTSAEQLNMLTLKLGQPSYSHIIPANYIMGVMNDMKSLN